MKMLTVSAFLCAMIALTRATALGSPTETAKSHPVMKSAFCSGCWTEVNGRCFQFVPRPMTWAKAEKNCQSMGGNLASIHTLVEYDEIRKLINSATYKQEHTWVGGSDAQEENLWLWSDGTRFGYVNWCAVESNKEKGDQHCLQIHHGAKECWDDCNQERPSICAKK